MADSLVIDSSVFISAFHPGDSLHLSSRLFLKDVLAAATPLILPTLVVMEVLNVIGRITVSSQVSLREIHRQLVFIPQARLIALDADFIAYFAEQKHPLRLRTGDLIIALCALVSKSVLVTWDKALVREASKYIHVKTPGDF